MMSSADMSWATTAGTDAAASSTVAPVVNKAFLIEFLLLPPLRRGVALVVPTRAPPARYV